MSSRGGGAAVRPPHQRASFGGPIEVRSPDFLVRGGVLPGVHVRDALSDGVADYAATGFCPPVPVFPRLRLGASLTLCSSVTEARSLRSRTSVTELHSMTGRGAKPKFRSRRRSTAKGTRATRPLSEAAV